MKEQEKTNQNKIEKDAEKLLEEKDADMRTRVYSGSFSLLVTALLIVWTIFQLYYNT